jgi:hypothetical protein
MTECPFRPGFPGSGSRPDVCAKEIVAASIITKKINEIRMTCALERLTILQAAGVQLV